MELKQKLDLVPEQPGVYLMRDQLNNIIYVGKAANLKNRVRSYFRTQNHPAKVRAMLKQVHDFEYIVTNSEIEALALECNFIKKHHPRYNILLRDDKQYPYLKLTLNETFPRLLVTRRLNNDGARYFGPYTVVGALNETLQILKKVFPLRTCSNYNFAHRQRPCLNFHIDRCLGPCQGAVTPEEYGVMVQELTLFLNGRQDVVLRKLKNRMDAAASQLKFEQAARLRDQIRAVEQVLERQTVVSVRGEDQDVIALATGLNEASVQLFQVRDGKLTARETFFLRDSQGFQRCHLLAAFLKDYYGRTATIPPLILLAEEADEQELIATYLSQKKGRKVKLHVPQRGAKKALADLAVENAALSLREAEKLQERQWAQAEAALTGLERVLDLPVLPRRIEGFDISNIQGQQAVGSMVVFVNGAAVKSQYRRFRIRTVLQANDVAMIAETVKRRYSGNLSKTLPLPDLVLIDGGPAQLSAARAILVELGLAAMPVIALAEQLEELFTDKRAEPIQLPRDSIALQLLQQIRDEAHRFALGTHRVLRRRAALRSELDEVPGIGPKRRNAIRSYFGSLEMVKAASLEELLQVPGLTAPVAEALYQHLHG